MFSLLDLLLLKIAFELTDPVSLPLNYSSLLLGLLIEHFIDLFKLLNEVFLLTILLIDILNLIPQLAPVFGPVFWISEHTISHMQLIKLFLSEALDNLSSNIVSASSLWTTLILDNLRQLDTLVVIVTNSLCLGHCIGFQSPISCHFLSVFILSDELISDLLAFTGFGFDWVSGLDRSLCGFGFLALPLVHPLLVDSSDVPSVLHNVLHCVETDTVLLPSHTQ